MLSILFWLVLALVLLLLLSALFMAVRRRGKNGGGQSQDESSPIYASGVYSLVRKSPRQELREQEPSLEKIQSALAAAGVSGSAQEYLEEWRKVGNFSINTLENGDREGIQTYRYQVPEKCKSTCAMFDGGAYVTREQLHSHVGLIPPFHLGCGVQLAPKEAWSAGSDNAGWTPILPSNDKYHTPDWRIVVKL